MLTLANAAHPESLARLPLVGQLEDPAIPLRPRAIDRRWSYEGIVPGSVAGFNPLRAEVYYGQRSSMAQWLRDPLGSARDYNDRDHLVQEVLFAVHDHLHAWAVLAIRELDRSLGLGLDFGLGTLDPSRPDALERGVFCLLLTEVVATVGLDYWFLSQVELGELVPIGTALRTLTTTYRREHLAELRRFAPTLDPGGREFFGLLARFYCTGEWPGLDVDDLRRSPLLRRWLAHELGYGARQREYSRAWLRYLAGLDPSAPGLGAVVDCDAPWQRALIEVLGGMTWAKVHGTASVRMPRSHAPDESWTAPARPRPDFRFTNLNALDGPNEAETGPRALAAWAELRGHCPASLEQLVRQQASRCAFDRVDPDLRALIAGSLTRRQPEMAALALSPVLARAALEPEAGGEPRDLFVLN